MSYLTKNWLIGLIVAAVFLGVGGVTAQQTPATARISSPTGSADLLQAPTANSHPIRSLPNDTEVMILAQYRENWYRVQLTDVNLTGWVLAEFLVIETGATATPTTGGTASSLITLGKLRLAQKQYAEAIDLFTQAIDLDPTNEVPFEGRGNAYMIQGKYQQAIADFSRAIELYPTSSVLYFDRAYVYTYLNQFDQALVDVDQAIALMNPDNADYYVLRGTTYMRLENYAAANDDFDEAIAINPDNVEAFFARGMNFYLQGQLMEALSDFNLAIEAAPDYADPYAWRGSIYEQIGGSELQIRADLCHHLQLAGENALPNVIAEIQRRGWQCNASLRNGGDVAVG